jgi:hypothetical protein
VRGLEGDRRLRSRQQPETPHLVPEARLFMQIRQKPVPTMDALTAFGLFAVTAMLVCYAMEDRSPWFVGVRWIVCARVSLWLPARGMAVRRSRSYLGRRRFGTLAKFKRGQRLNQKGPSRMERGPVPGGRYRRN